MSIVNNNLLTSLPLPSGLPPNYIHLAFRRYAYALILARSYA